MSSSTTSNFYPGIQSDHVDRSSFGMKRTTVKKKLINRMQLTLAASLAVQGCSYSYEVLH